MSGSESLDSSAAQNGGSTRRRRSLLYRLTDTITSFIPSLFESRQPVSSSQGDDDLQPERPAKRPRTSEASLSMQPNSPRQTSRLSISRVGTVNVPSVYLTAPIDVDVDLDARDDRSDFSVGSGTSVSTSGVSSLLPRSSRNEHNLVKPSPLDYRSEYIHQKNSSNTRKRESTELWINLERTRHNSSESSSTIKRMASDISESSVGTSFTSPFYHGRISYGGAASLRPANRTRSVFEHVTPLRFIMETDEEEKPKPRAAFLSATAQSILQSLEKHGSLISSGDKIPFPKSIPFSPLSGPLHRSTARYPSYMATYNRYKEFKKHSSAFHPSLAATDAQLPLRSDHVEMDGENITASKTNTAFTPKFPSFDFSAGPSKSSAPEESLQAERPPTLPTISSEQSQLTLSQPGASILRAKRNVEIVVSESPKPLETPTVRFDTKPQYDKKSALYDESRIFEFSSPISLKPSLNCLQPPANTSESQFFAFTKPKSQFKKAAPAEKSSFLPTLLSPRQSSVSDVSPAAKKAMVPSDLSLWRCESCLTENSERDGFCKSCRMPNVFSSVQKPLSSEKLTFLQTPSSVAWECTSSNPSCKVDIDASKETPILDFVPCKSSSEVSLSTSSTKNVSQSAPLSQISASCNGKWECPSCLVSNDDSREKCVCCAAGKPTSGGSSLKKPESTPVTFNFGSSSIAKDTISTAGFLFGSGSTRKPNSALSSNSSLGFKFGNSSLSKSSDGPKVGAQSSTDKWECPSCLVRNASTCEKCVCCQTVQPSSNGFPTPKASTSSSTSSFNFGASNASSPAHSGFVFGNAPTSNVQFSAVTSTNASTPESSEGNGKKWECPSCLVRSDITVDICPCCQTKKPSTANASIKDDKWECNSCMVMNAAFTSKCVCCATPRPDADPSVNLSLKTCDSSLTASMGSPPIIMSAVKSSNSYSQNAAPSFSSSFKFGEIAKTTSVSSSAGPSFSSKPADSGVDNTFKLGYKSATFSQPVIPTGPASMQNGGFQFSSPSAVPVFNFSAKKEKLTPAGGSNTPLFLFGAPASSTESTPTFKFGEFRPPTCNAPVNFNSSGSESYRSIFSAAGTSSQESSLNGRPIRRAIRRQRE